MRYQNNVSCDTYCQVPQEVLQKRLAHVHGGFSFLLPVKTIQLGNIRVLEVKTLKTVLEKRS